MTSYITNGYAELNLYFNMSSDTEAMITTLGFKNTDNSTDVAALLSDLRTPFVGAGKLIDASTMFNNCQLSKMRVTTRVAGDLYQGEDATPVVGTVAITATTGPPPNNTCFLIQKRALILGRRNRGRFYWPIMDLDRSKVNNLGNIDSTYATAAQTKWNTLRTYLEATTIKPPYILHNVSEVAPTHVTAFVFQTKAATQRRRMRP